MLRKKPKNTNEWKPEFYDGHGLSQGLRLLQTPWNRFWHSTANKKSEYFQTE